MTTHTRSKRKMDPDDDNDAKIEIVKEEIEKKEKEIESVQKELVSIFSDTYENKERWQLMYDMIKEQLDLLRQEKADLRNTLSQLMVTKETPFKKPRNLIHDTEFKASTLTNSPSASAKEGGGKAILKQIVFQPIYTHNFALELYNKFHETSVTTDNSLQICLSSIKSLFFLSIEDDSANPETKMEIYSTAILARAFDRFLFPDDIFTKGAVFHQLCSRKQPKPGIGEAPNIYISTISTTQDDSSLPDKILLVGDWKKSEFGTACTETHGYALTIFEGKYQQPPGCVFLGLAGTANHYKLFLYRPCNNHLHAIELVEGFAVPVGRKVTVGKLLRVMKYAIEKMRTKRIISRDCTLHCCCDGVHRMLHDNIIDSYSGNVVRQAKVVYCVKNNYVYKYYDCETEIVTCTYEKLDHLVELMKGLPKYTSLDLALESLSNCKRFARVKCRYIKQSDISNHSKNQAIMLLETLKSLHSLGYVHSDVRKNNILFDDTNDEAYLIDFDLCDKEDVNYPKVYNHASISERHKDASADKPRKKIHDVFSILKILQEAEFLQCYPVVDDIDAVRLLDELIEKLKN